MFLALLCGGHPTHPTIPRCCVGVSVQLVAIGCVAKPCRLMAPDFLPAWQAHPNGVGIESCWREVIGVKLIQAKDLVGTLASLKF